MALVLAQNKQTPVMGNYSSEELDLIKSEICKNATDGELKHFLKICAQLQLDPFAKQIYSIKRGSTRTNQISIDGFRAIATRTKLYAGTDAPIFEFSGNDRFIPVSATITVYRYEFGKRWPISATTHWDEFCPPNRPGLWGKMPKTMLAKCAEAKALRSAFPHQLSTLYSVDEMAQAGKNKNDDDEVIDREFISLDPEPPKQLETPEVGFFNSLLAFGKVKTQENVDNPIGLILDRFGHSLGTDKENKETIMNLSIEEKIKIKKWLDDQLR